MENIFNECTVDDSIKVLDIDSLKKDFYVEYEIRNNDMTSLATLLLLEQVSQTNGTQEDDDTCLQRLSLAYEGLNTIPQILLQEIAPHVKILDISYNNFKDLHFLTEFKELSSLICDHNNFTLSTKLPHLPKLELLWMNHCKISELYPWARMLQYACPNLKYLSLMGNQVCPHYYSSGNVYEYFHYKWFLISLFPNLIHLDDTAVTEQDRVAAQRVYQRPLLDRLVYRTHQNLPNYFRSISERMSEFVTPPPPPLFAPDSQKNVVI